MAAPARRFLRVGYVGEPYEPVVQLLQDSVGDGAARFVQLQAVEPDSAQVDAVFVPDQDLALAHIRSLARCTVPVRVLLRRRGAALQQRAWEAGLDWFRQCLQIGNWAHVSLHALTETAAGELSARLSLPVAPLDPLPALGGSRPSVGLSRDDDVLTFYVDPGDGTREARRARIDVFNWVRLRRLARLSASAADDRDLADLAAYAEGTAPAAPAAPSGEGGRACFLAAIPNGTGLGHLTRMMAIGRALQEQAAARVVFWSFSRAAELLEAAGLEVVLRQTAPHLGAHPPDWRWWETLEFAATVRSLKPQVVVYDGGTFDPFMIDALRMPGCGRCGVAWVRRGMLQPGSDALLLEAEQHCDLVLEPGDLAVARDEGPTRTRRAQHRGFSRFVETPPVTLTPFLEPHDRRDAKRRLGLRWGTHCLVSLGSAFGDWDELVRRIVGAAATHGVKLIWAQSPLAPAPVKGKSGREVRQLFPLGRYMAAFDGVITAAGYNSYHELMLGYDGPVLFAPTNNDRLDDQVARASHAGDAGWADVVLQDEPASYAATIDGFMRKVKARQRVTGRPPERHGADEMARALLDLARRYREERG